MDRTLATGFTTKRHTQCTYFVLYRRHAPRSRKIEQDKNIIVRYATFVTPPLERGLTPSINSSETGLLPNATGSVAGGFHGQVAAIAYKQVTNAQAMDNSSRFSALRMTLRRRVWPESPHVESRTAIYETFTILIHTIGTSEAAVCSLPPLLQNLR
jgi:hypothetical protein